MKLPPLESQVLQKTAVGQPYLKVLLKSNQAAVLPMGQAQEAIALPTHRVAPMPNMPTCVLGLLNHKSRVIWVADLSLLLGISTRTQTTQQYHIAIIRSGKTPLGLVVPEIKGIIRLSREAIEPPSPDVLPESTPFVRGCLRQDQETLWVLDPEAIIDSPIFTGNR